MIRIVFSACVSDVLEIVLIVLYIFIIHLFKNSKKMPYIYSWPFSQCIYLFSHLWLIFFPFYISYFLHKQAQLKMITDFWLLWNYCKLWYFNNKILIVLTFLFLFIIIIPEFMPFFSFFFLQVFEVKILFLYF